MSCSAEVFFDAETASFRGSFFGFQEILNITEVISPAEGHIFLKSGYNYFDELFQLRDVVKQAKDSIFYLEKS